MPLSRRAFLLGSGAFALTRNALAAAAPGTDVFEDEHGHAAPFLLCRRLHLDICGRLPTPDELDRFLGTPAADRVPSLVDKLLNSEDYADYWSMRFCDILRVKSEFPINLWPNAVYVYHRRIRQAVATDEPWDAFARALLGGLGSNFRVPEANFLRAVSQRTPEGLSQAASSTFLLDPTDRYARYFSRVAWKSTFEWKEEIVYLKDGPADDTPLAFAELLAGPLRQRFVEAAVTRVHYWLFDSKPSPARLAEWSEAFVRGGLRLKPLLRHAFASNAYHAGPITGGFPARRMDAEVLDDAISDLTGAAHNFKSIAPEPFTFLPKTRRAVAIEDGSITSSFLLLFGRPARDTGDLGERNNTITAKQRLYLCNSGKLAAAFKQVIDRNSFRRLARSEKINALYTRFLSRRPTNDELAVLNDKPQVQMPDLAWLLLNSREFLYRI